MKNFYLFLILIATTSIAFSQQKGKINVISTKNKVLKAGINKIFYNIYNGDWVDSSANVVYYMIININNEEKPCDTVRYYRIKENILIWEGQMSSFNLSDKSKCIRDGFFTCYFSDGRIDQQGYYINGVYYGIEKVLSKVLFVNHPGDLLYINKQGKGIIRKRYSFFCDFSEGFSIVGKNGIYGFIDKQGNEVIALKYDYVTSFYEGIAKVKLNGKSGFIDTKGTEIIPIKYDDIWKFSQGIILATLNGKYGLVNNSGTEITQFIYDDISLTSDGTIIAKRNNKYMIIDNQGKEIVTSKINRTIIDINSLNDTILKTGVYKIFLDSQWKNLSSSESAAFYEIFKINSQGNTYDTIRVYNISNNKVLWKGQILSINLNDKSKTILDDLCTWYYDSGTIKEQKYYIYGNLKYNFIGEFSPVFRTFEKHPLNPLILLM